MLSYQEIQPYPCVYLDAEEKHYFQAIKSCTWSCTNRKESVKVLERLWTNDKNKNHVMPFLSVRTAFDLYLRIMNFPPGSEVIMTAMNIPDMVHIVHHHKLRIVSLDIDLETMAPKIHLLDSLVTERTVFLLVAHIYGKIIDMEPIVAAAKKHKIRIIEDLAEVFCGFEHIGHPDSDLSLFSFGAIKFYTSFGGAIAKIRDSDLFQKMQEMYNSYPTQSHKTYLYKVGKYACIHPCLCWPSVIRAIVYSMYLAGVDHKKLFVKMLRGFPDNLINNIRYQPCDALLHMMLERQQNFSSSDMLLAKAKGDYVSEKLPEKVTQIGSKAYIRNYWLFPVIVENPDETLKSLNTLGVDAYKGATQLNLVEPDNGDNPMNHLNKFTSYPHEARYLVDHILYLPINKNVPFHALDKICHAVEIAVGNGTSTRKYLPSQKIKIQSKL